MSVIEPDTRKEGGKQEFFESLRKSPRAAAFKCFGT